MLLSPESLFFQGNATIARENPKKVILAEKKMTNKLRDFCDVFHRLKRGVFLWKK